MISPSEQRTIDPKLDNMSDVRTVHDMRRLRPCVGCAGFGDRLQMVLVEGKLWHTSCYRQDNGFKAVLALPKAQREKFRICDLTRGEMQRLLEQ